MGHMYGDQPYRERLVLTSLWGHVWRPVLIKEHHRGTLISITVSRLMLTSLWDTCVGTSPQSGRRFDPQGFDPQRFDPQPSTFQPSTPRPECVSPQHWLTALVSCSGHVAHMETFWSDAARRRKPWRPDFVERTANSVLRVMPVGVRSCVLHLCAKS